VAKVEAYAVERNLTFGRALARAIDAGVSGKALGGIRALLDVLEELADVSEHGVGATVEAVLDRTGYLAELETEQSIEAAGRIENLRELVGVAREFDEALERGDVVGAAANSVAAALGADDGAGAGAAGDGAAGDEAEGADPADPAAGAPLPLPRLVPEPVRLHAVQPGQPLSGRGARAAGAADRADGAGAGVRPGAPIGDGRRWCPAGPGRRAGDGRRRRRKARP